MAHPHPIVTRLSLSKQQEPAVVARDHDVLVTAGAGTGKTRTLVARYLSLVADGIPLRQIIAITFTRKAAQEMRNRVREIIRHYLAQTAAGEADLARWRIQYSALDAARIGTIHNLCGEILRTHPAAAGVDPRFEVLDEGWTAILQEEAIEATLAWAAGDATADPELLSLFALLGERALRDTLATLLAKRLDTATVFDNLATDILAHWRAQLQRLQQTALQQRLAHPAWQTHLATLQRQQATKADDRMEEQRRMVLTAVTEAESATSLASQRQALAAVGEVDIRGGSTKAWPGGKPQLDEVKNSLRSLRAMWRDQEEILNLSLTPLDETLAAALPHLHTLFAYACRRYEALKQERNALDFDDLEAQAVALLQTSPAVREQWQTLARALLVDEFQDTNHRQHQLVRLLCDDPGKLFIVGDAKQSIYRFRGADVALFREERERIDRAGGTVCDLDTSYRAHRSLVQGLNDLLHPVLGDADETTPAWVAPFAPLTHFREEAKPGLPAPHIEMHMAIGRKSDGGLDRAAQALVHYLASLVESEAVTYDDIAILCRASTSFGAYEDALDQAGIPFLTVAGRGFYQRPEIRDVLNALQAIADPHDDLALVGLLRSPACALSDAALYHLSRARQKGASLWQTLQHGGHFEGEDGPRAARAIDLIHTLHRQAGRTAVADLLKAFLDETGYRAALMQIGERRAARNVAKLLADAHSSNMVSVEAFLEYTNNLRDIGLREGEARATAAGAIQIMSVHAAKGLEFPIVVIGDIAYGTASRRDVLIDPEWGVLLPLANEDDELPAIYQIARQRIVSQETAESNRLFYVAATRAQDKLILNGCMALNKKKKPSRLRGWLRRIAEPAGLSRHDFSSYDEAGDGRHSFTLRIGQTEVAGVVYEPYFETVTAPAVAAETAAAAVTLPPPLLAPVTTATPEPPPDHPETPRRVWQVIPTARRPGAPAWVVGQLVHEALAHWRFPGAGFDPWLQARVQAYGLADGRQVQAAVRETGRLLRRLRSHPLFAEIDTADRRLHELPYVVDDSGRMERGAIDLLYLRAGKWTVVDFKTDRVGNETQLAQLIVKKGYEAQVQRYATAVQRLLGQTPRIMLCMLNYDGGIYVKTL